MGFRDDDEGPRSDHKDGVGYRKPPKHSRFTKGRSGNPRGKPRGTKNSATLLKQALLESVLVKQSGRETKTTKFQVIGTRMVHQAMQGDDPSIRLLFRYALDRLLKEPKDEPRGLSTEAAAAIRRALLGPSYGPETRCGSDSKNEASPAAYFEPEVRSGEGIQGQPYLVGYAKPPAHTRFQKGRSGNPAGRPRAPKSFRMFILRLLEEEVTVTESRRQHVVSKLQVIFMQIVNKAALGDVRFQALLLEYTPALKVLRRKRSLPVNVEEMLRKSFLQ